MFLFMGGSTKADLPQIYNRLGTIHSSIRFHCLDFLELLNDQVIHIHIRIYNLHVRTIITYDVNMVFETVLVSSIYHIDGFSLSLDSAFIQVAPAT